MIDGSLLKPEAPLAVAEDGSRRFSLLTAVRCISALIRLVTFATSEDCATADASGAAELLDIVVFDRRSNAPVAGGADTLKSSAGRAVLRDDTFPERSLLMMDEATVRRLDARFRTSASEGELFLAGLSGLPATGTS